MLVSVKKKRQKFWIDEEPHHEEEVAVALDFVGSPYEKHGLCPLEGALERNENRGEKDYTPVEGAGCLTLLGNGSARYGPVLHQHYLMTVTYGYLAPNGLLLSAYGLAHLLLSTLYPSNSHFITINHNHLLRATEVSPPCRGLRRRLTQIRPKPCLLSP